MKSLTLKRVLAIGLLMAGVAQQEAQGMARKVATRLGITAAAGLATAYGWHRFFAQPYSLRSSSYCEMEASNQLKDTDGSLRPGTGIGGIDQMRPYYSYPVIYNPDHSKCIATKYNNLERYEANEISIYNTTTKEPIHRLGRNMHPYGSDVCWHPDGTKVAIRSFKNEDFVDHEETSIKVFDTKTGKQEAVLHAHKTKTNPTKDVHSSKFLKNGKLAVFSWINEPIAIYDTNPNFYRRVCNGLQRATDWTSLSMASIKSRWNNFWSQPKQPQTKQ